MRISRIVIENFRNFQNLDVSVGKSAVIVGENQIGKTNLIYALRLLLDPYLPDTARQLRIDDFWDGLERPISFENRITISVEIADFDNSLDHLAVLGEHLIQVDPMVAKLTYEFGLISGKESSVSESDFEFFMYGGNRTESRFGYDVRKHMPFEVLHGLRDVEGDLARWSKSPLRPLIEQAKENIKNETLNQLVQSVSESTSKIVQQDSISDLSQQINDTLTELVGGNQAIKTAFDFSSTDPDKLLRSLRLFFDDRKRDVSEMSLGMANVLYLALRSLELKYRVEEGSRGHTFYGIEEPEAHLHPHLQRLVYRNYLRTRIHQSTEKTVLENVTFVLTTHSPHIASVTPVESLILLRKDKETGATIGFSGLDAKLNEQERDDIERYLDVSRAEGLFGRGILFVEGDAEKYLVPVLAECFGYDLDAYGITICSVGGTNFKPFIKFFGSHGLNIPLAIITDLDEKRLDNGSVISYGLCRAHALCRLIELPGVTLPEDKQDVEFYAQHGIFLNASTLEIELNDSGCFLLMNETMQELCSSKAAKKRFHDFAEQVINNDNPVITISDPERFIKDIEDYVGKGRFAQRLAGIVLHHREDVCPLYIKEAIKYVINKITLSDRG